MEKCKLFSTFFILFLGLAPGLAAQPSAELMEEWRAYVEREMAPVLREAQKRFDAELPAEDLTFIQGKRREATVLRAQREELMSKAREAVRSGADPQQVRANMRGSAQEIHIQSKDLFQSLRPFIEGNREVLHRVLQNLRPQYEKWTADQEAMFRKYLPEEAEDPAHPPRMGLFGLKPPRPARGEKMEALEAPSPRHQRVGERHPRIRLALEFVLWDGSLPDLPPAEPPQHGLRNAQETATGTAVLNMKVFPNPAAQSATVRFDLPRAVEEAALSLLNTDGRVVQVEKPGPLEAGSRRLELDLSDLPPGVYTCRLQAGEWTAVRQLLVQR